MSERNANVPPLHSLMRTMLRHPAGYKWQRREGASCAITPPGRHQAIILDRKLAELWKLAEGKPVEEVGAEFGREWPYWQEGLRALRLAGLLDPPLTLDWKQPKVTQRTLPDPAPLVSVVIPTRNGRHHLEECIPSILAQSYPQVDLVIVDDASEDGTAAYLAATFPRVRVLEWGGGPNFAAACNVGARHATGEYIFFLNNDTVLHETCIQELVSAVYEMEQGGKPVAGAAAMMRLYDAPAFINGLGTRPRRMGFGYDIGLGSLDIGQFDDVAEVPALCFGAALVSRAAWEQVGPLDEVFGFYYEDTDWSYRARLMGLCLAAAPRALVFHKFSATMKKKATAFKIHLATRNRLWFVVKNLPVGEAVKQVFLYYSDDWLRLLTALSRGQWALVAAIPRAWLEFWKGLPGMLRARKKAVRVEAVAMMAQTLPVSAPSETPTLTAEMVAGHYARHLQAMNDQGQRDRRQRLLIISPDAVHSSMGGVGIRYWELALQLAEVAKVTLAVPRETDLASERVNICTYNEGVSATLRPLAEASDIILLSGFTIYHHPFLRESTAYIVVDLYDPMILENLERFSHLSLNERRGLHDVAVRTFNDLFARGDFFICASEKQRDYWLGALTAANRVNPTVYAEDPTLQQLIAVVPFGLPAELPQQVRPVLKGVWPGIGVEDKVILWGGGLWDWLDPLTVIEAMPTVLAAVPEARLFFLGTRHPNPDVPVPAMVRKTIARAETLGLKGSAIFFNDWTPYAERGSYLSEADIGVSLHGDHIETRFAVRTRIMDYLWGSLPMVVNGGDVLSDLVAQHGLGRVVEVGDRAGTAAALIELLRQPVAAERFAPIRATFRWQQVTAALMPYVKRPWMNAGGGKAVVGRTSPAATGLPGKVVSALRRGGVRLLAREVAAYWRWISER